MRDTRHKMNSQLQASNGIEHANGMYNVEKNINMCCSFFDQLVNCRLIMYYIDAWTGTWNYIDNTRDFDFQKHIYENGELKSTEMALKR